MTSRKRGTDGSGAARPLSRAACSAPATSPVRGQSVTELHGYFGQAREAWDGKSRTDAAFGRCELFGRRLIRAPARSLAEVLLKIEVAEWLGDQPADALAVIREDIFRLQAAKP